ncbi:hypothetical protein [Flavobacterium ardleyense]|uniref:hypothetical protein n=1 Tax=Flavobacterium ardleyense TaxID=2038737 RepID=UPI00298C43CC|nr:hypothetical protein [Flavobacterium ardleyense]
MAYNIDFAKRGEYLIHIKKFFLYPNNWNDTTKQILIPLKWKKLKFNKVNKNKIPKKTGLYCFIVNPKYNNFIATNYLFYIGKTNNSLFTRYGNYLDEQSGKGKPRDKVYEMLNIYKDDIYFYYTEISHKSDVDLYEETLLNVFVPHVNTSIPEAKINTALKNIYEK